MGRSKIKTFHNKNPPENSNRSATEASYARAILYTSWKASFRALPLHHKSCQNLVLELSPTASLVWLVNTQKIFLHYPTPIYFIRTPLTWSTSVSHFLHQVLGEWLKEAQLWKGEQSSGKREQLETKLVLEMDIWRTQNPHPYSIQLW